MLRRRICYLLALAAALVFYGAYGEWLSWVLLVAVAVFPWLSLGLSLPAMLQLRLKPELPGTVTMGADAAVRLLGGSALPPPPWRGRLRLEKKLTGERWTLKQGGSLPTEHCGVLRAAPFRGKIYDYLGLFKIRARKLETAAVVVLPKPVELAAVPELDRYLARAWRPKFGGGFAENHELRLYRPGDSLNQVHWKLSAKTGELILREPMEPERGLLLLTMDVSGTPEELDRKFGRLLWLGEHLLERGLQFCVRAMTGGGAAEFSVSDREKLLQAVGALLDTAPVQTGSVQDRVYPVSWQYHIGGGTDEG